MVTAPRPDPQYTPEEYLAYEEQAQGKNEYFQGRDGRWLLTELQDVDRTLVLDSLGISLSLRSIYQRMDWLAA